MPHLTYTLLVASLLSVALSMLGNRSLRERLCAAIYLFLCFTFTTLAGSWAMFLIHG
jgi:hypothetical protein